MNYLNLLTLYKLASVGVLSVSSGSSVNYVKCKLYYKRKRCELSTKALTNSSGYKNKVTIKITTSKGVKNISGTVFGEDVQRVVDLDGFQN